MKKPNEPTAANAVNDIVNFLDTSAQFRYEIIDDTITICQAEDRKELKFKLSEVEKVLMRNDFDGTQFIQVNFSSQAKILITKALVGFKPTEIAGFDSTKIPRVVTTVDLQSITKALEDLFDTEDTMQTLTEIDVLKKVFQSILLGAETVGFDMHTEKRWLSSLLLSHSAASA